MMPYPKPILSIPALLQKDIQAGLTVPDIPTAETSLMEIGYYRFLGYRCHVYDYQNRRYLPGTTFDSILQVYRFDTELRTLLFGMSGKIEVALRARLSEALLLGGDPFSYLDSCLFDDKEKFWKNISSVSSEIARSSDVFIRHQFTEHDGQIPVWVAVEVMSFGTLSKYIRNMKTGAAFQYLADFYRYPTQNSPGVRPSRDFLSSWTHSVSTLRNVCAHGGRIYNRSFSLRPTLLAADRPAAPPQYIGLYEILLAMKYLSPSHATWADFSSRLSCLISRYQSDIDVTRLNFPADWAAHF